MSARNIMIITSSLLFALVIIGVSTGYAAPPKPPIPIIREEKRGHWSYTAFHHQFEGRIYVEVMYPNQNATQLEEVAATQRQLADELITGGMSSIDATIVFRRPLDQVGFERFITSYGLETAISSYLLRYVDQQGQRVTITGAPNGSKLVPHDLLETVLNDLQQRAPGKLLGWVEINAVLSPDVYRSLANDRHVYLVDVSRSVVRAALRGNTQIQNLPVDVVVPQIYWTLEDVHLAPQ